MKKNNLIGIYATLLALCALLGVAYIVSEYYDEKEGALSVMAREKQVELAQQARLTAKNFEFIYSGMRTISYLPAIQRLKGDLAGFGDDAAQTVQLVYNVIAQSAEVSEVYCILNGFDPEQIDPRTNKLQVPVLMYDQLIVGAAKGSEAAAANPNAPEEVEIYEYRAYVEQLRYFYNKHDSNVDSDLLVVPALVSPELITCDNSEFPDQNADDRDRKGITYSIPFYSVEGQFKGIVTAVIRTNALRRPLRPGLLLYNPQAGYQVAHKGRFAARLAEMTLQGGGEYFWSQDVAIAGLDQPWRVSGALFLDSPEVVASLGILQQQLGWNLLFFFLAMAGVGGLMCLDLRRRTGLSAFIDEIGIFIAQSTNLLHRLPNSDVVEFDAISKQFNLFLEQIHGAISAMNGGFVAIDTASGDLTRLTGMSTESIAEIVSTNQMVAISRTSLENQTEQANDQVLKLGELFDEMQLEITNLLELSNQTKATASVGAKATVKSQQDLAHVELSFDRNLAIVSDLQAKIGDISGITESINMIAAKTNLLALNAAIEAAKAGDSGRGFAVVADEVRRLAENSHAKVTQITALVEAITESSEQVVSSTASTYKTVQGTSQTTKEAFASLSSIEQQVSNIASSMEMITSSLAILAQKNKNILELMSSINNYTHDAKAADEAAMDQLASIQDNSAEVTQVVSKLRSSADSFKGVLSDFDL